MKKFIVILFLFFIYSCGGGTGAPSQNQLVGGTEVGNPPLPQKNRDIVGELDGSIDCRADQVRVTDSAGESKTYPVDDDCQFRFDLETGKVYSLSFYKNGDYVMTLRFHDGHQEDQEFFYLSEGDAEVNLGLIVQSGDEALSSENPTAQNDQDGDGLSDFEDLDDDNDGILDIDELDCDGDGIVDDLDLMVDCQQVNEGGGGVEGGAIPPAGGGDDPVQGPEEPEIPEDNDLDDDLILNEDDNCILVANFDQGDQDADGLGDPCDDDRDGDGIENDKDNCPNRKNYYQLDADGDGFGDSCDNDPDNDGLRGRADNCPLIRNFDQSDDDDDGVGNACDFTHILAGVDYNCAIREYDGSITCWGQDSNQSWVPPFEDNAGFVNMSIMNKGTCAIKGMDGSVHCWRSSDWPDHDDGRYYLEFGDDNIDVAFLSGAEIICTLSNLLGSMTCWFLGPNGLVRADDRIIDQNEGYFDISIGSGICGIRNHNLDETRVDCDFINDQVIENSHVLSLHQGNGDTCVILVDNESVYCFKNFLRYPDGNVPINRNYKEVHTFGNNACGLKKRSGEIFCWGPDVNQLSFLDFGEDIINQDFKTLSVNRDHICGLKKDGRLFCWGDKGDDRSAITSSVENPNSDYRYIEAGIRNTCAIKNDGHIYCWGDNQYINSLPEGFKNKIFRSVSLSSDYACAIQSSNSQVFCWGEREALTQVPDNLPLPTYSLTISTNKACVVAGFDKQIFCWGDENEIEIEFPVNEQFLDIMSIQINSRDYCVVHGPNNQLSCYDENGLIQLIDLIPQENYSIVKTFDRFGCGLQSHDNQLYCWDMLNDIALSRQRDFFQEAYEKISLGKDFVCAISSLNSEVLCHSLTMRWDDSVYPYNDLGKFIIPKDDNGNNYRFSQISAGHSHVCGIEQNEGKVICWGSNGLGAGFVPHDI